MTQQKRDKLEGLKSHSKYYFRQEVINWMIEELEKAWDLVDQLSGSDCKPTKKERVQLLGLKPEGSNT